MSWEDLNIKEKSDLMRLYISNGIMDLDSIKEHYNAFQDGGNVKMPRGYKVSSKLMKIAQRQIDKDAALQGSDYEPDNGMPQATFLMSRKNQQKAFEQYGYTRLNNSGYGPVANAVTNSPHKDIPVYQKYPDVDVNRDNLQKIGTFLDNASAGETDVYKGPQDSYLPDPAYFPVDVYIDRKTGKVYNQGWDFNDYHNTGKAYGTSRLKNIAGNLLDRIGSPTVVTTGLQKNPYYSAEADNYVQDKTNGLLHYEMNPVTGDYEIMLPSVTVTAKRTNPVSKSNVKLMSASELNEEEFWDMMEANSKQNGGKLGRITHYGQWQYPGKVTTIPSNNITMKGVNYPVIGVSDTGDTKYMLPNMDYLFDGQYVTEYPVNNYQSGGQLNNIPFYLLGRDSNTGVINPKSLYIPSPDKKTNSVTKNKYSDNRIVEINNSANGDYTSNQFQKNEELLEKWDPTGGFDALNWFMSRKYGNLARGEENEYYRAYLGLSNDIPKMSPNAQTEWDYKVERDKILNGELESDFYGTTEKINRNIQAMVDTLNLGKILRGEKPLPVDNELSNKQMRRIYKTGKEIMENPNKWIQVDFDKIPGIEYKYDDETSETNPLGMFGSAGVKWNPEEGAVYIHDTYDFPWRARVATRLPERPREMKIRGKIDFNTKEGSILLR